MKKSAGFTLIELVIVIIILGILGAVAAPRLFNLQGDAYGANLNALKSSISTAATMANAKAQIEGKQTNPIKGYTEPTLDEEIVFVAGYPAIGTEDKGWKDGILGTLDGFEYDRYEISNETVGGEGVYKDVNTLTISPKAATTPESCKVVYTEAAPATPAKGDGDGTAGNEAAVSAKPAKVEAVTTGC